MPDFSIEHLTQKYGRKMVLQDINMTADAGECIGIVGSNGSGKSTLLSTLAGIRPPVSGEFHCFSHNMRKEKRQYVRLIGYLPQESPVMEDLSAADNLKFWYGKKPSIKWPVVVSLELGEILNKKGRELSGGMKRRLSIACALAFEPKILLMDEPTASLDLYHKKKIQDYIRKYAAEGNIVILSTHDPEEIRMCSRLYYIDQRGRSEQLEEKEAISRLVSGGETGD